MPRWGGGLCYLGRRFVGPSGVPGCGDLPSGLHPHALFLLDLLFLQDCAGEIIQGVRELLLGAGTLGTRPAARSPNEKGRGDRVSSFPEGLQRSLDAKGRSAYSHSPGKEGQLAGKGEAEKPERSQDGRSGRPAPFSRTVSSSKPHGGTTISAVGDTPQAAQTTFLPAFTLTSTLSHQEERKLF